MHSDLYMVLYKPPYSNKFYPIIVFDTLQAADKYIEDNNSTSNSFYIDLIQYRKE